MQGRGLRENRMGTGEGRGEGRVSYYATRERELFTAGIGGINTSPLNPYRHAFFFFFPQTLNEKIVPAY